MKIGTLSPQYVMLRYRDWQMKNKKCIKVFCAKVTKISGNFDENGIQVRKLINIKLKL